MRNFASFITEAGPEPEEAGPLEDVPLGLPLADWLVSMLRASGVPATDPGHDQNTWDFGCQTEHLWFCCEVGWVESLEDGWLWLLVCSPERSLRDWWRGQWWEQEQEQFFRQVARIMESSETIRSVRWYSYPCEHGHRLFGINNLWKIRITNEFGHHSPRPKPPDFRVILVARTGFGSIPKPSSTPHRWAFPMWFRHEVDEYSVTLEG